MGSVVLVGAGPGDPELLTLKAVRALQSPEVVLYDDLVSSEVLDFARREAKKMLVGKTGYRPSCKQDDINSLMVQLAKEGRRVVALKGGDPMIFGRAGKRFPPAATQVSPRGGGARHFLAAGGGGPARYLAHPTATMRGGCNSSPPMPATASAPKDLDFSPRWRTGRRPPWSICPAAPCRNCGAAELRRASTQRLPPSPSSPPRGRNRWWSPRPSPASRQRWTGRWKRARRGRASSSTAMPCPKASRRCRWRPRPAPWGDLVTAPAGWWRMRPARRGPRGSAGRDELAEPRLAERRHRRVAPRKVGSSRASTISASRAACQPSRSPPPHRWRG